MKTALITGVTGQDGSYLAELLLDKGYKVVGLIRRNSSSHLSNAEHLIGKVEFVHGDLTDQSNLNKVVKQAKPDEVYNLAAQSVPRESWKSALYTGEVTALGPQRVMEAVLEHAPKARFYQASSSEIYGAQKQEKINEEASLWANNPYGVAKAYAHRQVAVYRESYDFHASAGILFNHESPRRGIDFLSRKITMGVALIKAGSKNVPINEDGEPMVKDGILELGDITNQRDWGYSGDYVRAMWMMLQQDEPDDYVIGTGVLKSVQDVCEVAFVHVGLSWQDHVRSVDKFKRPTEISAMVADATKAREKLGWKPEVTFEELITMMVDSDLGLVERQQY
jgi:GDPmannose 4,6-dehydratase